MGLILGIINVAILLNNDILAASAARVGGRTTAVTGNQEQGKAKAGELLKKTGLLPFEGDIKITNPGPGTEYITSEVTYRVPVLVPGFASLLGGKPWDNEVKLKEKFDYYVEYRHHHQ